MTALLELKGVESFYGSAHILHGINLQIDPGERVAVLGRNGVGKTTIVNSLVKIVAAKHCQVLLAAPTGRAECGRCRHPLRSDAHASGRMVTPGHHPEALAHDGIRDPAPS